MSRPEPSRRNAAIEAGPGLLLSTGMLAASTQAILTARARADDSIALPVVADFSLVRDAASSPTAWLVGGTCAVAIAIGIRRRSHIEPAIGLLVATAVVYFRVMHAWLEPVTGIIDTRLWAAVMWLYMPQSLAIACFAAHVAIAYRRQP